MSTQQTEVAIVGGGIVGVSCAYFLQEKGCRVTIIEREHLAYGASGRNAGFIWLSLRPGGVELKLAKAGAALYPQLADDLGDVFEYRRNGGMIYCFDDEQLQVLRELAERRRQDGLQMDLVDARTARDLCPILPDTIAGATYCGEDAQIYTPKFVRALGDFIRRRGGTVREGVAVTGIDERGGRVVGVDTSAGRIGADVVVLATGSWAPMLARGIGLALPIRPMRLQAVATKPLPRLFDRLLYGPLALKQYSIVRELPSYRDELFRSPSEASPGGIEFLECLCQRQDGTVMMGCPMDYPGYDQTATLEGVGITAKIMAEHIPALRDAEVGGSWAGLLPATPDSLPYVGYVPSFEGLVVAAGHVFGNAAGPITGKLVAELIRGERPSLDMTPFRVDRHSGAEADGVARW